MNTRVFSLLATTRRTLVGIGLVAAMAGTCYAQAVVDPALGVRTAASGLQLPTGMVFLASNDWLVIEKNTGRVRRVRNGAITSTVLDLAVNNGEDRGLLGIVLHPQFATNRWVYLFYTCRAAPPPQSNPYVPTATTCPTPPALGADTGGITRCRCSATASPASCGTAPAWCSTAT